MLYAVFLDEEPIEGSPFPDQNSALRAGENAFYARLNTPGAKPPVSLIITCSAGAEDDWDRHAEYVATENGHEWLIL